MYILVSRSGKTSVSILSKSHQSSLIRGENESNSSWKCSDLFRTPVICRRYILRSINFVIIINKIERVCSIILVASNVHSCISNRINTNKIIFAINMISYRIEDEEKKRVIINRCRCQIFSRLIFLSPFDTYT
jgi:hypothetical protein